MQRYQNLLVCLNLSDQDEDLIRYARLLAERAGSRQVAFMHIMGNPEVPATVYNQYPSLIDAPDQFAIQQMEEKVRTHFGNLEHCRLSFKIISGSPLDSLLRFARSESTDLILIGRRRDTSRTRRLSEKLTHKAPCPVLVFPEGNPVRIRRIMIATDFSDHASRALDAALAFARSAQAEDLYCFHAYSVPENYEVTGQSYQDFSAFLLRQASEAYARSIQGINPGNIDLIPVFEQSGDLSSAIQNFATREKIDLVLVGARGAGSGIVDALGSTTETLLQTMALPLLSIKQKGESGQVLDLLFKK